MGTQKLVCPAEEDPTILAHIAGCPPSSHHTGVQLGATLPSLKLALAGYCLSGLGQITSVPWGSVSPSEKRENPVPRVSVLPRGLQKDDTANA